MPQSYYPLGPLLIYPVVSRMQLTSSKRIGEWRPLFRCGQRDQGPRVPEYRRFNATSYVHIIDFQQRRTVNAI